MIKIAKMIILVQMVVVTEPPPCYIETHLLDASNRDEPCPGLSTHRVMPDGSIGKCPPSCFFIPASRVESMESTMNATLMLFSARDAKTRFGEVLDTALGRPVGITKHDRLTAYVVSKNQYEGLLQKIEELEERLWAYGAELAREEGFATAKEVDALLASLRNPHDAAQNKQAGTEIPKRSRRKAV